MENIFTIRHYIPEQDLPALSRMLTEIESMDRDGEDTSEEYLRASLAWPNYRPAQDVWVAEMGGNLVGYALALEQPSQRCTIYVVVHPMHRRKRLGSQLLERILQRARELGAKTILVSANEHNQASNLFLNHHGFQQVASSGWLKQGVDVKNARAEFPSGFTLKRYSEVSDPLVLLRALNECYRGMWGHQHNDNPSEAERRSPSFLNYYEGENILLLFDEKDAVVGICSVKPQGKQEPGGELSDLLDAPGIIPLHREQDYQRPMVLAGIEHLRKTGTHPIALEFWGDSENALNIYRSLGFEMVHRYITYHKELP
jgi:mycothiol synthase